MIPVHSTSLHFTSLHFLHSIPARIPLLVNKILTPYLKVFSLQGKDASRFAGNWFQVSMVIFKKEYLPTSEGYLPTCRSYDKLWVEI